MMCVILKYNKKLLKLKIINEIKLIIIGMDVSRAVLDNLMGRDRNKPNDLITERDHYSNPDVCKPFLVCLCFNTLFPNTTYD